MLIAFMFMLEKNAYEDKGKYSVMFKIPFSVSPFSSVHKSWSFVLSSLAAALMTSASFFCTILKSIYYTSFTLSAHNKRQN